jgi:hypothetical protein
MTIADVDLDGAHSIGGVDTIGSFDNSLSVSGLSDGRGRRKTCFVGDVVLRIFFVCGLFFQKNTQVMMSGLVISTWITFFVFESNPLCHTQRI